MKNALYKYIRYLYRKLPPSVVQKTDHLKWRFFAWHYKMPLHHVLQKHKYTDIVQQHQKIIFINSAFEFDDLVNQRPINAAKYFAKTGHLVIFITWQWSPDDKVNNIYTEVIDNVIQVPLFDFLSSLDNLDLHNKQSIFLNTFPADIFEKSLYTLRSKGAFLAYDIMDDWQEFYLTGEAPWFNENYEASLILFSDYVCVVSQKLQKQFSHLRSDIEVIGNGYSENILGNNKNIVNRKANTVGYFGHLTDSWFDWELVFELSTKYTHLVFEIIGYGEPAWVRNTIHQYPNIKLLGKVHPNHLPQYVKNWKIGLIPFKKGELSSAVDPIKIYEYIYFGLPSFVTGIDGVANYPMTHYATHENRLEIFESTLNDQTDYSSLSNFLQQTTWENRFNYLEKQILSANGIRSLYV